MRRFTSLPTILLISVCLTALTIAQTPAPAPQSKPAAPSSGPADPKAIKTFASAVDWQRHGHYEAAMDDYRKANKQDGGHCAVCLQRAYDMAIKLEAYKDAIEIARELLSISENDAERANAHWYLAMALQVDGIRNKKERSIQESRGEFKAELDLNPNNAVARYNYGITLARLHQDDAARAEFTAFLDQDRKYPNLHPRAERFVERVELARATMAPPFSLTTLDGQHISMDGLAGKVVLIDFWATWCGPCREALPHIRQIAKKFEGQPLVVLSISQDGDEAKWREFVEKNGMTWLQYCDRGTGPLSRQFGVHAIPATFTIDSDGVLEDQHVGDADIEGKLKKLIARATAAANKKATPGADKPDSSRN
ncbi:MAG: redoxin domain-containing protein [Terracidiphilus sp.]|jgi:thiol-disulfide isomerase/thioredoxin